MKELSRKHMRVRYRIKRRRPINRNYAYFLAPIAIVTLFLAITVEHGPVIAAAIRDPMSVLAQRSPGDRLHGALTDTKPARPVHERVLGLARPKPTVFEPASTEPALAAELPEFIEQMAADVPPDLALGYLPGPPTILAFNDLPRQPPTGPSVPGAVPEPATWLMNILGLFGVGAVLRRRKSGAVRALPALGAA